MHPWFLVAAAALVGWPSPALNHDLLNTTTSERPGAPPTSTAPRLRDGDRWLCSVGQSAQVNAQALTRATEQGWGFWSFAAHAGCPAGVYLAVAHHGRLRATGEPVWSELPIQTNRKNHAVQATTVISSPSAAASVRALDRWRPIVPVRATVEAWQSGFGSPSWIADSGYLPAGSAGTNACSDGHCGVRDGWQGGSFGFGDSAPSYRIDDGGFFTGNSSGGCAACAK